MAETVLSTRGQVVIPADVRRKLGLEPSARLRVSVHDGAILLTPVPAEAAADAWLQAWDQECARRSPAHPGSWHDLLDEALDERNRGS